MKRPGTFGSGAMAMAFVAFALSMSLRCRAEPADDADFATQQADARKSFKEVVTPFVNTYCTRCHGQDRQKGGINFGPALKNPGETASSKRWKQALAMVTFSAPFPIVIRNLIVCPDGATPRRSHPPYTPLPTPVGR